MGSSQFQSHPTCPSKDVLHEVRCDRASGSSQSADFTWPRRSGSACSCPCLEVCRSPSAASAIRDLCKTGVELERSTLADWVGSASKLLEPLNAGQTTAPAVWFAYPADRSGKHPINTWRSSKAHSSPLAGEALNRIAEPYVIEREMRGRSPDERKQVRQARSTPLIAGLHE